MFGQMKATLRIATAVTLLCLLHHGEAADAVYLLDRDDTHEKSEELCLYIADDGRLVTDAGNTATFKSLAEVFARWRGDRTEPRVTLILYPRLKSNSDLKKVRRVIDFLRANHVFAGITIEDMKARVEKGLL